MARYDANWGPSFRGGAAGGAGWYPAPAWEEDVGYRGREGARWRDDRDFEGGTSWGGGQSAALYGPGRYGLGPYHERLRRRRRPDQELKDEVEEALFYDTWVDAEAITVEVKDGVVTLRGELPSYEEIRYATDDAWDVDGVIGVRSELTVRER